MASINTISTPTKKHGCPKLKRKITKKIMAARFRSLKTEMADIKIEQGFIKEGQRQVRKKIKEIEEECEQLKEETKQIINQSAKTQIRLALMFNILKARQEGDFAKASQLARLLRETMSEGGII